MAVRVIVREPQLDDIHFIEAYGLSTDDKPLGVATGSLFIEVDTGKAFLYDEEGAAGSEWCEVGGDNE